MNQLTPSKTFFIVRQLDNSQDPATYYVQAKVYLGSTNAVLATVNLTNLGNQLFSGSWVPPADPTGNGFYVYIVVNVYTNSGYSVLSDTYATTSDTYQVLQQINPNAGFSGGGGFDWLTPSKFRELIKEELKLLKQPEYKSLSSDEIVGIIESRLEPINDGLDGIKQHVSGHTGKLIEMMNQNQKKTSEIIDGFSALLNNHSAKLLQDNKDYNDKFHGIFKSTSNLATAQLSNLSLSHESRMKDITEKARQSVSEHINSIFKDEASKRREEKERLIKAIGHHTEQSVASLYDENPIERKRDFTLGISRLLKMHE